MNWDTRKKKKHKPRPLTEADKIWHRDERARFEKRDTPAPYMDANDLLSFVVNRPGQQDRINFYIDVRKSTGRFDRRRRVVGRFDRDRIGSCPAVMLACEIPPRDHSGSTMLAKVRFTLEGTPPRIIKREARVSQGPTGATCRILCPVCDRWDRFHYLVTPGVTTKHMHPLICSRCFRSEGTTDELPSKRHGRRNKKRLGGVNNSGTTQ